MFKFYTFLAISLGLFFVLGAGSAYAAQVPKIESIVPTSTTVGTPDFHFFVYGDKLRNSSIIHFVDYPMMIDYEYGPPFVHADNNDLETILSVTPPGGLPAHVYRVLVENDGDFSEEIVTFTVYNAAPTATNLSFSSNACPALPDTGLVYFFWTYNDADPDTEKKFEFQVDDTADFSSPVVNRTFDNLTNPSGTLNQQAVFITINGPENDSLMYDKTYYWRVRVWQNTPVGVPYQSDNSGWVQGANYTTIANPWPYADFSFTATSPAVNFTNNSICYDNDGICNTYLWAFGDGLNSNLKDPSHAYSTPNNYNVSLTVTDGNGLQCEVTKPLNAPNKPYNSGSPIWREISPYSPFFYGSGVTQCQDGIDNDGDLLIDYPNDPQCSTPAWLTEAPPQCSDGIDNDGDTLIDFPEDGGCVTPEDNCEDDADPMMMSC